MMNRLSPRHTVQKRKALSLPLVLALLLTPLALQATPAVADQDASDWHIEIVDSEGRVGEYTSLALDESGYPHISYRDSEWLNGTLKYAYQDASGWHIEIVDSEGDVGGYTSLALDKDGYPHISYHDYTNHDLKYAYQGAYGWHIETVDSEDFVGTLTSLALDGSGYPHISYYYCGTAVPCNVGDLKYAYRSGPSWHIETVDSEGQVGWYTSLTLDGGEYPHISYYYCGTSIYPCNVGDLKYAYQNDSGWHIETVDSEGNVGGLTSVSLDGDGYPHISYLDYTNDDLKYAYQDASGWHTETVDSEGDVGLHTSLTLDGDGYPHISYLDYSNHDLKYAYQDASGWHIETVDSEGDVGEYTSLALDEGRYLHISYHDSTNGDLKYAYYRVAPYHVYLPTILKE
jgi:catechol 2,3-dioxygenase-like lactoylglutathione lyase family enzyme